MLHKSISKTLIVAAAILVAVSFSACRITGGGVVVSGGDSIYRYHYYPDAHVYFDVRRQLYFYLSDGDWKVAVRLPHHLRIRLGDHVNVDLRSSKPYRFHNDHRRRFPPGHFKRQRKWHTEERRWRDHRDNDYGYDKRYKRRQKEDRRWRDRDDDHRGGYDKRKKRKRGDHD